MFKTTLLATTLSRRVVGLGLVLFLAAPAAFAQDSDQPPPAGAGRPRRHGPPFAAIANELGIPVERVRAAFQQVGRPPRGSDGPPTQQQLAAYTQALASAMDVPAEKLRAVLDKYRPAPPPRQ